MSRVASVDAYQVAIPPWRRGDTVAVFKMAADRLQTLALNGHVAEATPELALVAVAGGYRRWNGAWYVRIPQPWIVPLFRDVLGLSPEELRAWNMKTSLIGGSFVLRAFARAIEYGDL